MIKTFHGEYFATMSDYFQSRHWKKLRLAYFDNKKNQHCVICRSEEDIRLTHKYLKSAYMIPLVDKGKYKRVNCTVLGRESFKDLRTLCGRCHELIYAYKLLPVLNKNKIATFTQLIEWVRQRQFGNNGTSLQAFDSKDKIEVLHHEYTGDSSRYEFNRKELLEWDLLKTSASRKQKEIEEQKPVRYIIRHKRREPNINK